MGGQCRHRLPERGRGRRTRALHAGQSNRNFHRSIEAVDTARSLGQIFSDDGRFAHHEPLPAVAVLGDEGAANHSRFCANHRGPGVHFFVYGTSTLHGTAVRPARYPARQTREACEAVARLHQIRGEQLVFAQQSPDAIDAGVFHNDVIATGNERLHLFHEQAFADGESTRRDLEVAFARLNCGELFQAMVSRDELSLEEAVGCYLFNSQIVTLSSGGMALIAPAECEALPAARQVIDRLMADAANPLREVRFLDLRQSMRNGGGPACLRLRVVLTEEEIGAVAPGVFINDRSHGMLADWVRRHYRESLTPDEMASPDLLHEGRAALAELTQILGLGSFYHFQRS